MVSHSLSPFRLERWFVEFEFVSGIRNLTASAPYSITTKELLALENHETTARYLNLDLNYVETRGGTNLRQAVSDLYTTLTPEHIQITTGASEALLTLAWALLEPGANIIIEEPGYEGLTGIAEALGFEIRHLPLRLEAGWKPDLDQLAQLIDNNTRLIYLVSPHNPTGAILQVEEMQAIARMADRVGAQLVNDEVFRLITLNNEPIPSIADVSENAISIGDMSKPWGLGGLRVGWLTSRNQQLLRRVSEARDYSTISGNAPGEFLAEIALRHSSQIIAPRLATARTNREYLAQAITQTNARANTHRREILSWQQPEASYTAFVQLPFPTEDFCRHLALERKVLLLPGSVFGPHYDRFIRLGIGGDAHEFQAGLSILLEELSRWQER